MFSELHIRNILREDKGRWVAASRAANTDLAAWVIAVLNAAVQPVTTESPNPSQVKELREKINLHLGVGVLAAQDELAKLLSAGRRTVQQWEAPLENEKNNRAMHPAFYRLAKLELAIKHAIKVD